MFLCLECTLVTWLCGLRRVISPSLKRKGVLFVLLAFAIDTVCAHVLACDQRYGDITTSLLYFVKEVDGKTFSFNTNQHVLLLCRQNPAMTHARD